MAILVTCPACGAGSRAKDQARGLTLKCPGCSATLKVEGARVRDHDVFVSYSHHDKSIADRACAALEARKIRCWMAPRDLPLGTDWSSAIIGAIEDSRVMVLLVSSATNTSQQVLREVERAVAKRVQIIPLRLQDVPLSKSLEYFLSACHWLDVHSSDLDDQLQRLADHVRLTLVDDASAATTVGDLDAPGTTPATPVDPNRRHTWPALFATVLALVLIGFAVHHAVRAVPSDQSRTTPRHPEPSTAPTPSTARARLPAPMALHGQVHLEGDELAITHRARRGYTHFVFGDPNWSSYDFEFQAIANSLNGFRVQIHWSDPDNFDDVGPMDFDDTYPTMSVCTNGQSKRLAGKYARLEPDRWHTYRLEVRGPSIHCVVDDKPLVDAYDGTFSHGRIALVSSDSRTRYRNLRVTTPDGTPLFTGPPDLAELPSSEVDQPGSDPIPPMRIVDLLKGVNVRRDTLSGHWERSGDALVSLTGAPAQLQFNHDPSARYNLRVRFTRPQGDAPVSLICRTPKRWFCFTVGGARNTTAGIGAIKGASYDRNQSTKKSPAWIANRTPHELVVAFRNEYIRAYLDGTQIGYLNPDQFDKLDLEPSLTPPTRNSVGIATGGDAITIDSADIIEIGDHDIW
jgi:hypothetical protein